MASLAERITAQIRDLQAEKQRIDAQYTENIAAVDTKIQALRDARQAMTPAVELAYLTLVRLGLVKEI